MWEAFASRRPLLVPALLTDPDPRWLVVPITWNLDGVYFDTPNPAGAEHFGYDQHPLTQTQKDTLLKTAVVTTL